MPPLRFPRWFYLLPGLVLILGADPPPAAAPTRDAMEAVTSELSSGDEAAVEQAIEQIHVWLDHRHVSYNLWYKWIPALMQDGKYQEAADLAMEGMLDRPEVAAMTELTTWRTRAFLAMNQPQLALAAARSNYNVCDLNHTQNAIDLVGLCLAACNPGDDEIIRRFRNEQAVASEENQDPGTQPSNPLLAIVIDATPYKAALRKYSVRTVFKDRVSYGNLLLAAGRCGEAEKVYRDLYKLAATQDEMNTAVEGIARSLRAEDGTLGRANAWLAELQRSSAAATQP
ncbi:MAG TPA: hypothetical protein VL992_15910 [Tepidisphaeraceae bacterium]|nr:hypothetical protein [Tepidisphaeraceae bacterium]